MVRRNWDSLLEPKEFTFHHLWNSNSLRKIKRWTKRKNKIWSKELTFPVPSSSVRFQWIKWHPQGAFVLRDCNGIGRIWDFKSIPFSCSVNHGIWIWWILKSQTPIEIPYVMDFEILRYGLRFWNPFHSIFPFQSSKMNAP